MPDAAAIRDLGLAIGALAVQTTAAIGGLTARIGDVVRAFENERTVHAEEARGRDAAQARVADELAELRAEVAALRGRVEPRAAPASTSLDALPRILAPFGKLSGGALTALVLIAACAAVASPVVVLVALEHARLLDALLGGG